MRLITQSWVLFLWMYHLALVKSQEVICPAPHIENGFVPVNIQEYKEHDILHFGCDAKHKSINVLPSKCTKRGLKAEWSPTPGCEPIVCRLSAPLEGTSYEPTSRNVFSPGDTVRVNCGNKHWISNLWNTSAEATCKENGDWTLRPVCQEVRCRNERQQYVSRWNVRWNQQIKMDDTVGYSCYRGYKKTDGATDATCTRNGWAPNILCQEITCNRRDYQNANIAGRTLNMYKNNERVSYNCKNGYEGHFTLTCKEKGWTGTEQCTKVCKPIEIDNAQFTDNAKETYRINEQVDYTCRNDPKRVFTVTCDKRGWTGRMNCSACQAADVPHGIVVGPYNDTLYYTCKIGYKLSTKGWRAEAKCTDGVWSGLKGCIANTTCGNIPEISNGRVTPFEKSEDAQITCEDGYHAQITNLTCHKGKWLSEGFSPETICKLIAVPCNPPRKVDNAVIVGLYQKEYLSDSNATYQCRDKYIILDNEDTIQCKDGTWEAKRIMCTPYCDKLKDESINFTTDKERYMDGDVIEYQCAMSVVEGTATCDNTEWNKSQDCTDNTCEVAMMQPNLSVTGLPPGEKRMKIGLKLQFHCDDEFTIEGSTEIECLHTGEWNAAFPTCAEKCEVAYVPNSVYLDKYVRGDQLNKGQRLSFNCRSDGDTLQGKAVVECSAGGQWSDPFPTCGAPAGCGRPPQVENGDITQSVKFNYRHGDWVEYGCQNYYVMNGYQYKTCLNGEWNQPTMRCLNPCTVDRRAMSSHNIHFGYNYDGKMYSSHDDHITFACDRGKRSDGTFEMRQRCDDGVMNLPTCQ
ncbi:coagulation factor XIII B chain-like isoform X1 [Pseudoliparis swirei]|uniref:coagulation factor XIII B chain-like isoform X1 n=1 Tax=Pseudoliparis swirei TaxID=2059687 RepID=UPI0024BDEF22|nr:coagulation factor XIII B chain-like isoform X1 [Pseudoliparis swirei]